MTIFSKMKEEKMCYWKGYQALEQAA